MRKKRIIVTWLLVFTLCSNILQPVSISANADISDDQTLQELPEEESMEVSVQEIQPEEELPVKELTCSITSGKGTVTVKESMGTINSITDTSSLLISCQEESVLELEIIPDSGYQVSFYRTMIDSGEIVEEILAPDLDENGVLKKQLSVTGIDSIEIGFEEIPEEVEVDEEEKEAEERQVNTAEAVAEDEQESENVTDTAEMDIQPMNGGISTYMTSADQTVNLHIGDTYTWGGYRTRFYSADDGTNVYCLQPLMKFPDEGQHQITEVRDNNDKLTKVMYYGYGGPGFESSGLSTGDWKVDYTLTHYTASYVYDGCRDDGSGSVLGALEYSNVRQVLNFYNRLMALPDPPVDTCTLIFDGGYNSGTGEKAQVMGLFGWKESNGSIEIRKESAKPEITDNNSAYSLEGAVFGIFKKGTEDQVATITTDKNGYGKADGIPAGDYDIREIEAPPGYALNATVGQVTVSQGQTVTYRCKDWPQSDPVAVLLGKIDAETNQNKPQGSASLANAEFTVKYYQGFYDSDPAKLGVTPERSWVMKTNENGYCRLSDTFKVSGDDFYYMSNGEPTLPLGTITIQETKAPKGYLINNDIFIRKITSEGNVEGVATYNQPEIPEQPQKGIIRLQKLDEETNGKPSATGSLEGAVYEVFDGQGQKVDTLTTDKNGKAQSKELPLGTYTIKEKQPSSGYVLDQNTYTVTFEGDTSNTPLFYKDVTSKEKPQQGVIRLQKVDAETGGNPGGDGTLEGAKYGVYDSENNKVDTMTTNKEGKAESKKLPLGTYTVKELESSEGYIKDDEAYTVTLSPDTSNAEIVYKDVTSKEIPQKGVIKLEKVDSETDEDVPQGAGSLKGAIYEVSDSQGQKVDTLTTDKNGKAQSKELPLGTYTVKEVQSSTGYNEDQQTYTVKLTSENREERVFYKTQESQEDVIRGDVQIVKFAGDQEGEDTDIKKPLEGIKFTFESKTTGKKYTIVTDENGYANTQQLGNKRGGLAYDTYIVTEESPYPEYEEIKPFEVTISEEGRTLYYIIEDDAVEAAISVVKKDSTTGKVIPVAGTKFQILDKDKNVLEMTVTHYPELITQDTWETDSTGSFMLPEKLLVGTYYLQEVQAPEGYLKGELLKFEITDAHDWDEPIVVEYEDAPVMGNISIQKTDEETGEKLAGAVFEVIAAEDIVTPDGTLRANKDQIVDTLTTDAQGQAISKNLYLGSYKVKEIQPAPGYVLPEKTYPVELKYKDQTTAIVTESLEIANSPTTIIIDKKVAGSDETLADVKFEVWNKAMESDVDPGIMNKETVITDKNGRAVLKYLLPGTYCIQEVEGVPGYAMDTTIHEFVVDEDGKIDGKGEVTVTIENEKTEIVNTAAVSTDTGTQEAITKALTTITDTINFKNLQVGAEIVVKGVLMDKDTGKELLINGEPVTAQKTFIAEKSEQSIENIFAFDATSLAGKTVVVFERAYIGNVEIAAHTDLEDTSQTVHFPEHKIHTTAIDKDTGKHQGIAKEKTTIVDEVNYSGLIVGQEYTVKGTLMDKTTGKEFLDDGKPVTAEKTFKAESSEGSISLEFIFDSSALKGKAVVVFERLYVQDTEVAVHTDLEDDDQTVEYPEHKIHTTATDKDTGKHQGIAKEKTTIVDEVNYSGLIVGQEYTVKGTLMDKTTGKEFLDDGKPVTAEKTFKAESSEGSISLEFIFDSSALKGKAVVVFERLYVQDTEVAVHTDLEDNGQTVEFPEHKIGTQAKDKDSGTQKAAAKDNITIVDVVSYTGLIPDETYTIKGILMDKATGEPLLVNAKQVTAEKTFKAEKASGEIEIEFTFNATFIAGKEVVVFERMYAQGQEVAVHTDINDKGQTVKIKDVGSIITSMPHNTRTGKNVKTGDEAEVGKVLAVSGMSLAVMLVVIIQIVKRRKERNKDEI